MPRSDRAGVWRARAGATLLLLSIAAPAAAQFPPTAAGPDSTPKALVGARLFDGTGGPARSDMTIVIRNARVTEVFRTGARPLPSDARVIDLHGRTVVPGIIDGHVHLATEPDGEDNLRRTKLRLRSALYGGVTTVRDMAGDTRVLAGLARDALVGSIESPNIYYAALMAGPAFFKDPRTASSARGRIAGQVPWMRAITPETDFAQVVAEAHGTGATALKLYAMLTPAEVFGLSREAHAQGMRVWAHADLNPARPMDVVRGGADAISHAGMLSSVLSPAERKAARAAAEAGRIPDLHSPELDALFKEMRARHTILEPTLFIYGEDNARERMAAAITRAAHRAGVTIMAGTDSIGAPSMDSLPDIHKEMEALVQEGGLSPAEALVAAGRNAALAIGIAGSTGTLVPGHAADLVVLRGDPLADIHNTASVVWVMKSGRIYRRPAADER